MTTPDSGERATLPLTLPFCELHVHLEGTLEPETIFGLANRNQLALPYRNISDLKRRYAFNDLQSFLNLYYENMSVLRREQDFFDLATAYLTRAHLAGVQHVEMFIDPQAHRDRGVTVKSVLSGVHKAIQAAQLTFEITGSIIVCVLRDRPAVSALDMLEEVVASGVPVVGIGLDSAEVGHPPAMFKDVFAAARSHGYRCVAHAGEEGPPDYIWQALDDLGAERIDHGVRCLEDDQLVARLVSDKIPLTICPLSNVRLGVVDSLAALPLRTMLDRGLLVTVNSDDPAYFAGYLEDNIQACTSAFTLSLPELETLAGHSILASFASAERKAQLFGVLVH